MREVEKSRSYRSGLFSFAICGQRYSVGSYRLSGERSNRRARARRQYSDRIWCSMDDGVFESAIQSVKELEGEKLKLTLDQEQAYLNLKDNRRNLFITGGAGTGTSFLI